MNDRIEMAPAETARELHGLAHHGQRLDTDWQSTKSAIAGNEGGIGGDLLGQAFLGVYLSDSAAVRAAADTVPAAIMNDAALGHHATADYVSTDGGAGDAFGKIG
jgi:hypothetical protein